jgi:hypothetical protein
MSDKNTRTEVVYVAKDGAIALEQWPNVSLFESESTISISDLQRIGDSLSPLTRKKPYSTCRISIRIDAATPAQE